MATSKLETDITRLKTSIGQLEAKLKDIDAGLIKNPDPALVPTLIETKDRTEALLSKKEADLKFERESGKAVFFGGTKMFSDDIARLSIGGSLKTSTLNKSSVDDTAKKKIIEDIFTTEPDETKRATKLLEKGFIVQRKM